MKKGKDFSMAPLSIYFITKKLHRGCHTKVLPNKE